MLKRLGFGTSVSGGGIPALPLSSNGRDCREGRLPTLSTFSSVVRIKSVPDTGSSA